jgi:hypothetical protein
MGTPNSRFLRRAPRSLIPNSLEREVAHRDFIENRHRQQVKLAEKRGRTSKDCFKVGDRVRLKDPKTLKWDKKGVIKEQRQAPDGRAYSFIVSMDNGRDSVRHKSHIKHHESGNAERDARVSFADKVDVAAMDTKVMTRARSRALANIANPAGAGVLKKA